jgi:hypothetical protein
MKTIRVVQLGVLALLVVLASLTVVESLWWNNAQQSYPRWLVSAAPANANDLPSLRQACGNPLEVAPEGADMALVRCGTFWPTRSIWLVPKAQVSQALARP